MVLAGSTFETNNVGISINSIITAKEMASAANTVTGSTLTGTYDTK